LPELPADGVGAGVSAVAVHHAGEKDGAAASVFRARNIIMLAIADMDDFLETAACKFRSAAKHSRRRLRATDLVGERKGRERIPNSVARQQGSQRAAWGEDRVGNYRQRKSPPKRFECPGDSRHKVGADEQLHLFVETHKLFEFVRRQFPLQARKQNPQANLDRPSHVLVAPNVPERRIRGVVGAIDKRPINRGMPRQKAMNQLPAFDGLWGQTLPEALGFVGVIDEDGIPKVKRNNTDLRHCSYSHELSCNECEILAHNESKR
jgi:hypothetical protein